MVKILIAVAAVVVVGSIGIAVGRQTAKKNVPPESSVTESGLVQVSIPEESGEGETLDQPEQGIPQPSQSPTTQYKPGVPAAPPKNSAPVVSGQGNTTVQGSSGIVINGKELSVDQVAEFKQQYGVEPVKGKYWYDSRSGFYGFVGGPTAGVMNAGHSYGLVSASASNGTSGVFINGRQLQNSEALGLAALFGAAPPGRYWMDSSGNIGVEGTDYPIANLYIALATTYSSGGGGGGSGGDNFWSSRFSAGNSNNQGQGYVSVPGYGPVGYGF